ncbi:MAG: hypothetical protein M0Z81_17600 [Deltaproteobacteria bacterium]|nr:hypothetical protein [Deltaproteobacteria bacterium]
MGDRLLFDHVLVIDKQQIPLPLYDSQRSFGHEQRISQCSDGNAHPRIHARKSAAWLKFPRLLTGVLPS